MLERSGWRSLKERTVHVQRARKPPTQSYVLKQRANPENPLMQVWLQVLRPGRNEASALLVSSILIYHL